MIHEHSPLLVSHLDSIASPAVREAYLYLTHHAATLREYECRPQAKGLIKDFRYYQSSQQPFAFIVNKESLLWYVRPPGLRHPAARLAELGSLFTEVSENKAGEIKIRIDDLPTAQLVTKMFFGSSTGEATTDD